MIRRERQPMCPDDSAAKGKKAKEPSSTDVLSRPSEWSDEIWDEEKRNPTRLRKFTLEERWAEGKIIAKQYRAKYGKLQRFNDDAGIPWARYAVLYRDYDAEDRGDADPW
jgi:hypothetical protein